MRGGGGAPDEAAALASEAAALDAELREVLRRLYAMYTHVGGALTALPMTCACFTHMGRHLTYGYPHARRPAGDLFLLFAGDCMRPSSTEDVVLTFVSVARGAGASESAGALLAKASLSVDSFAAAVSQLLELSYVDRLHRDGAAYDVGASCSRYAFPVWRANWACAYPHAGASYRRPLFAGGTATPEGVSKRALLRRLRGHVAYGAWARGGHMGDAADGGAAVLLPGLRSELLRQRAAADAMAPRLEAATRATAAAAAREGGGGGGGTAAVAVVRAWRASEAWRAACGRRLSRAAASPAGRAGEATAVASDGALAALIADGLAPVDGPPAAAAQPSSGDPPPPPVGPGPRLPAPPPPSRHVVGGGAARPRLRSRAPSTPAPSSTPVPMRAGPPSPVRVGLPTSESHAALPVSESHAALPASESPPPRGRDVLGLVLCVPDVPVARAGGDGGCSGARAPHLRLPPAPRSRFPALHRALATARGAGPLERAELSQPAGPGAGHASFARLGSLASVRLARQSKARLASLESFVSAGPHDRSGYAMAYLNDRSGATLGAWGSSSVAAPRNSSSHIAPPAASGARFSTLSTATRGTASVLGLLVGPRERAAARTFAALEEAARVAAARRRPRGATVRAGGVCVGGINGGRGAHRPAMSSRGS